MVGRAIRQIAVGELARITIGVSPDEVRRRADAGHFPFPRSQRLPLVPWHSPRQRALLDAGSVHLGRTLRRRLLQRGWVTSLDEAFEEVMRHCADREWTWITSPMREALRELHRRGEAHSLEVWDADGRLIGGTFGVQTGGLVSADSLFHTVDHASKVALVDLASRVRKAGGVGVDCQYITAHTRALGAQVISRTDFLRLLADAREIQADLQTERLPAARLADHESPDAVGSGDAG
ncbi:leucyl/phenylalanyl-tRNA--protein transferase [Geodermatophilus sp. SYSU D01106]